MKRKKRSSLDIGRVLMFGLNFLKKLYTSYSEKRKPVVTMTNFGVFIRSAQNDVVVIGKCKVLLRSIQSDTNILHAISDEVHNGLKVFFNCGSGIAELLKKKFLSGGDDSSTIHSLTTALIVHQAFPSNEEEFKESIRNQIGNLISVQVLDIKKVPLSLKYPDIGTGKWIIVLDIPEIDELDEFKTMGLPNNMVLKFPTNDDYLRVEFYCRLCQKEGHVQLRCLGSVIPHSSPAIHSSLNEARSNENIHPLQPAGLLPKEKTIHMPGTSKSSTSSTDLSGQKNLSPKRKVPVSPTPSASAVPRGFRIRDLAEETAVPKPTGFQRDIEDFIREIGKEEVYRSLSGHDRIKKEISEPISSLPIRPNLGIISDYFGNRGSNEIVSHSYADDVAGETSARASSTTTEKDSLEIIYESNPNRRQDYIQSPPENSPVVTTSNQLPPVSKRELPSTDEDSNPAPPKRQKKTLRLLQVVIPDGIREIISGMPAGVLDILQLEAFFNHVKKKSRPSDFAAMYTSDVEGLHSQLVAISRVYYMSPKVGSNADVQFMKMIGNVLKRFYNAPAQRKGSRQ